MKAIYCILNLFSDVSPILIKTTDDDSESAVIGFTSMSRDVPADLCAICHGKGIYELRIGGPPEVTEVIAQEVRSLDNGNYNENRINVEII